MAGGAWYVLLRSQDHCSLQALGAELNSGAHVPSAIEGLAAPRPRLHAVLRHVTGAGKAPGTEHVVTRGAGLHAFAAVGLILEMLLGWDATAVEVFSRGIITTTKRVLATTATINRAIMPFVTLTIAREPSC